MCGCKTNVVGEKCDACAEGVNHFPNCDKCAENWFSEHEHHEHCEGDHTHLSVDMVQLQKNAQLPTLMAGIHFYNFRNPSKYMTSLISLFPVKISRKVEEILFQQDKTEKLLQMAFWMSKASSSN